MIHTWEKLMSAQLNLIPDAQINSTQSISDDLENKFSILRGKGQKLQSEYRELQLEIVDKKKILGTVYDTLKEEIRSLHDEIEKMHRMLLDNVSIEKPAQKEENLINNRNIHDLKTKVEEFEQIHQSIQGKLNKIKVKFYQILEANLKNRIIALKNKSHGLSEKLSANNTIGEMRSGELRLQLSQVNENLLRADQYFKDFSDKILTMSKLEYNVTKIAGKISAKLNVVKDGMTDLDNLQGLRSRLDKQKSIDSLERGMLQLMSNPEDSGIALNAKKLSQKTKKLRRTMSGKGSESRQNNSRLRSVTSMSVKGSGKKDDAKVTNDYLCTSYRTKNLSKKKETSRIAEMEYMGSIGLRARAYQVLSTLKAQTSTSRHAQTTNGFLPPMSQKVLVVGRAITLGVNGGGQGHISFPHLKEENKKSKKP